jgi:hypothetical protein
MGCTLSLKLGDPPVCPVNHHALQLFAKPGLLWVDRTNTGCLRDPQNRPALMGLRMSEEKFYKANFSMRNFVPQTCRGLFDVDFSPAAKTLKITVRLFCDFVTGEVPNGVPPKLAEGYKNLKEWTEFEKPTWMAQASVAVGDAWDNKFTLVLNKPGWRGALRVRPIFRLEFVSSKSDAHVAASVTKIPPVDPEFFNCGGTFVGLDQIIQNNPLHVSKAALTSQSGVPVTLEAVNVGIKKEGVIHYNVMAHEFGHMIGLPDEYEKVQRTTGSTADNAKAIHKDGTLALAQKCRIAYAIFGAFTESIMSRGTTVMKCHYITVWQALTMMTKDFVEEDDWDIE